MDAEVCHYTLAVMATAGLYETSGGWLYDIGVPGKSGLGGGIVVVSPGKSGIGGGLVVVSPGQGALAAFAPALDEFGNSVKGPLAARFPVGTVPAGSVADRLLRQRFDLAARPAQGPTPRGSTPPTRASTGPRSSG